MSMCVEDQARREVALVRGEGCVVCDVAEEEVGASFPGGTRCFHVRSQHEQCEHDPKCQWIDLVYCYRERCIVVSMGDLDRVSVGTVIRRLTEV